MDLEMGDLDWKSGLRTGIGEWDRSWDYRKGSGLGIGIWIGELGLGLG